MQTSADNLRFERKFLPRARDLEEVLSLVHRHPAGFREVYPHRAVNNIYLDSPSLQNYSDHVCGLSARSKTRIRWYGPLTGRIDTPLLEHKIKRGSVSRKSTQPLVGILLNGGADAHWLRSLANRDGLSEPARRQLLQVLPSLINRYCRHYFLSADGDFRLTVDSGLQFFHPARTSVGATLPAGSEYGLVLELKFSVESADRAEAVTRHFPFRMARCSKYVLGIESLNRI